MGQRTGGRSNWDDGVPPNEHRPWLRSAYGWARLPHRDPPFGGIGSRHRHETTYIFSSNRHRRAVTRRARPTDLVRLRNPPQQIGLLPRPGCVVGEVIRPRPGPILPYRRRLLIRESKFGKSRIVPLHPSVLEALQRTTPGCATTFTLGRRRRASSSPSEATGRFYPTVQAVFRNLCDERGIGADAPSRPGLMTCDIPSPSAPYRLVSRR